MSKDETTLCIIIATTAKGAVTKSIPTVVPGVKRYLKMLNNNDMGTVYEIVPVKD